MSDGVHEFMSNDEMVAVVHACAAAGHPPAAAAAALVTEARARWEVEEHGAADDCTAVVAYLGV